MPYTYIGQSKKEQPQPLELVPSQRVVQANQLIRAKQDRLTLLEARLVRLAISQVLKDDTDFRTYKVSVSKLSKLLNVSKASVSENIDDIVLGLSRKQVYIDGGIGKDKGRNYEGFSWASVKRKDGVITIKLSDDLKPYLLGLNELFTRYEYENLLELPSDYSIRLYEILVSYQSIDRTGFKVMGKPLKKNQVSFTIDELREYTNCTDKYPNNVDFIKYVVRASAKAISETTNLYVWYKPFKDGRSFKYIIFDYLNSFIDYKIELRKEEAKQTEKAKKKALKSIQKAFPSL